MVDHADEYYMRRALSLAATRAGDTWPNPTVAAVLVKDGQILSEGLHLRAGEAHAEVVAIREAGEATHGATLYVTLEPCNHHGRTAPCTRAIQTAQIARVVYAVSDANPDVSGGGGEWLREQGIEVQGGLLAPVAWELNHPFFETEGGSRAHLTLKLALSYDGRIARSRSPEPDPLRRKITGVQSHRRVHRIRARSSVVMVGRRTAAWDRPRLDVRLPGNPRQPRPVLLDPALRLDPSLVLEIGRGRTALVICGEDASARARESFEDAGIELVVCPGSSSGELSAAEILAILHARGLGQVLLEGGWATALPFLREGLVDRLHLFRATYSIGGAGAGPGAGWPEAEGVWESYLLARRGEDTEAVLRRIGAAPRPDGNRIF